MKWFVALLICSVSLPLAARAQLPDGRGFVYDEGFDEPPGIGATARVYQPAVPVGGPGRPSVTSGSPRRSARPPYRFLPLTCVVASAGSGDVVVSLDQDACRASSPRDEEAPAPDRLPSPYELAWIAADRAMSVAEWPRLEIAPSRIGLTGLRTFLWLDHAPAPVTASASIPGLVVTAEAHPVRYEWSFGDGPARATTHPGRAWSRRRPGNVAHLYERRGRYPVRIEVVWEARWRMGAGAWRHLGYFSNEDSRSYPVRQMAAMLSRRR